MPSFKINLSMKMLFVRMIYVGEHDSVYVTLLCEVVSSHS